MKTKPYIYIAFAFIIIACSKEKNEKYSSDEISTTKRILSKLNLINLEEGIIEKQKIKEVYDLLAIIESNKKNIDTIAKDEIFKIFNNDSLAKTFIKNELEFLNNEYKLDSIGVSNDSIIVLFKNKENVLKRKFYYKLVKDSIINNKLPPTVFFKILHTEYHSNSNDSIINYQKE